MTRQVVPWDSQWREIPGFRGYFMNQYGQVFNSRSGIVLKEWTNKWYGTFVTLRRDNTAHSRSVPKLYALLFPDLREADSSPVLSAKDPQPER